MLKSRLVLEKANCEDVQFGVDKLAGGKRILVRSRSISTFDGKDSEVHRNCKGYGDLFL